MYPGFKEESVGFGFPCRTGDDAGNGGQPAVPQSCSFQNSKKVKINIYRLGKSSSPKSIALMLT
jgi:hypothetical protein